jgi:tRNA-splicing ligase RtcB (3'-phosphate/5'-hydroxy nucleic acid ligase)
MKVFDFGGLPVKSWCENPEEQALEQAKNLSLLPFAFSHISLMPDTHCGYGMPIGGVLATKGVIIPNAVGVDIGCGMCAIKTNIKDLDKETIKLIMGEIRKAVPVGFDHQKEKQDVSLMPTVRKVDGNRRGLEPCNGGSTPPSLKIVERQFESALKQIGTLGGGNHFIEIQKDEEGFIWIMIHSGSRNFGLQVAKYYNELAIKLNEKWYTSVPKKHELAFLPIDSEEGKDYYNEMSYCVEFALANRKLMMERIKECFVNAIKDVSFEEMINIAHNYARFENHFGVDVMIHRKGATLAREGTIGIIPGSQGTSSYIVKGKGNKDSFESCSHGAGRKMSRGKAIGTLNLEEEIKKMNDLGIVHGIRSKGDLDESMSAYKDIDVVMEEQKDLVDIMVKLKPLAVIKG